MNKSKLEVTCQQLREQVKIWWSRLADDDLDRVTGNVDQFSGQIQTEYGYSRQPAQQEFDQRRDSLSEILAKRIEKEFERRLAKLEARQQNRELTR